MQGTVDGFSYGLVTPLVAYLMACLGGALLGVMTGRWLRFPGASAVVVVALVFIDIVGWFGFA